MPSRALTVTFIGDDKQLSASFKRMGENVTGFENATKRAATTARKGIETRLSGTFDQRAFVAYDERVARAERISRDRAAFKAELGAKFNPVAFNAYERAIDKARRDSETLARQAPVIGGGGGGGRSGGTARKEERSFVRGATRGALGVGGGFIGGGLIGGLAGVISAQGIKSSIDGTVELVKQAKILAHYTGMGMQSALQFQAVAGALGVSSRSVNMGFKTLATSMNSALIAPSKTLGPNLATLSAAMNRSLVNPTKASTQAFRELGITEAQVKGHTNDVAGMYKLVADRLKTLPSDTQRTAVATKLLGAHWKDILQPTGAAMVAFKQLGITQDEIKAHSHDLSGMMGLVADKLNAIPPGAERTALASKLLGRNWQQLAPLLMEGSRGMQEQLAQAKALGVTLGGDPLKNIQKLHDAQINLKLAQTGLSVQFTEHVAPALIKMTMGAIKLAETVRTDLTPAFKTLSPVAKDVGHWIGQNKGLVEGLVGAIVALKVIKTASGWMQGLHNDATQLATLLRNGPGAVSKAWNILMGTPTGKGGKPGSVGSPGSTLAGKAAQSVATMEVGEMIVKSMIGGPSSVPGTGKTPSEPGIPGAPGSSVPGEKVPKPSRLAKLGKGLSKIGRSLPFAATAIALADTAGITPGDVGRFGSQNTHPSFNIHPGTYDPSLGGVLSNITGRLPQQTSPVIPGFGRTSLGGVGSSGNGVRLVSATVPIKAMTIDAERAQLAIKTLGSYSAQTFALMSAAAARANDTRFAFADHVASSMLKAKGVNQGVVTDMLATLGKLPPGARTQAANTAVGMAAQLEAQGALPKGSADRIRSEITQHFRTMRIDSVRQASVLVTDMGKEIDKLPKRLSGAVSKVKKSIADVFTAITNASNGPAPPAQTKAGNAANNRKLGHYSGGIVKTPTYMVGEEGAQHPEVVIASNPSYRKRNVGLWKQAGRMLGIPGYAKGGIPGYATGGVAGIEDRIAGLRGELKNPWSTADAARIRGEIAQLQKDLHVAKQREALAKKAQHAAEASQKASERAAQRAAEKAAKATAKLSQESQDFLSQGAGFQTVGLNSKTLIPSQSVASQIRNSELSNALQAAQNSGNVPGQQTILNKQLIFDRGLLSKDTGQLATIKAALRKPGLSKVARANLQAAELAILQDIGGQQSNIGSVTSALDSLTGASSGSSTLSLDLANIRLPTSYEAIRGTHEAQHGVTQLITNHIQVQDIRAANQVGVVLNRFMPGTGKALQRAGGLR